MFAFAGCATPYRFQVDALARPDAATAGLAYRLVEDPESTMPAPLQTLARRDLEAALAARGMFAAPETVQPDLEIIYAFTVEGPFSTIKTRSEPVPVFMLGEVLMGERVVAYEEKSYRKTLRLTAREMSGRSRDRTPRELWSLSVANNDRSRDGAACLPPMIAAAGDFLGENTQDARDVVLTKRGRHLLTIRSSHRAKIDHGGAPFAAAPDIGS